MRGFLTAQVSDQAGELFSRWCGVRPRAKLDVLLDMLYLNHPKLTLAYNQVDFLKAMAPLGAKYSLETRAGVVYAVAVIESCKLGSIVEQTYGHELVKIGLVDEVEKFWALENKPLRLVVFCKSGGFVIRNEMDVTQVKLVLKLGEL